MLHFTSLQLSGLDFSLATQVDLQVVQHREAGWLSVPENETSADWCFYCFEMFLLKKRQLSLTAHYDCRQRRVFVVSWLPADGFNDNECENQTGSKKYSLCQSLQIAMENRMKWRDTVKSGYATESQETSCMDTGLKTTWESEDRYTCRSNPVQRFFCVKIFSVFWHQVAWPTISKEFQANGNTIDGFVWWGSRVFPASA